MFTGIVECTGVVTEITEVEKGRRLSIAAPPIVVGLVVGDSVAVRGACLTAVEISPPAFTVELVAETIRRTVLGELTVGDRVNLERAMPGNGRFDGHIVQGHVDGVGTVVSIRPEGEGRLVEIAAPADLRRYIVAKGSITVDGVSLTVAGTTGEGFQIALIPHTLAVTTLGTMQVGDRLDLEVDILPKYVERLLEART
ncbi:MAG: riboflavin synthase [Acidimicrobiia bacterium]